MNLTVLNAQLNNIVDEHENWTPINHNDLQVGDVVKSEVYTYSQKWLLREGYEEVNMKKIGILINKDEEGDGEKSTLYICDGINYKEMRLYVNPYNSGFINLYRYNKEV